MELYNAKNGNRYYAEKKFGGQTDKVEKCTTGVLISAVLMFLLIGPFLIFSEYGGLTSANPVLRADMSMSLFMNKTIFLNATNQRMMVGLNDTLSR